MCSDAKVEHDPHAPSLILVQSSPDSIADIVNRYDGLIRSWIGCISPQAQGIDEERAHL